MGDSGQTSGCVNACPMIVVESGQGLMAGPRIRRLSLLPVYLTFPPLAMQAPRVTIIPEPRQP